MSPFCREILASLLIRSLGTKNVIIPFDNPRRPKLIFCYDSSGKLELKGCQISFLPNGWLPYYPQFPGETKSFSLAESVSKETKFEGQKFEDENHVKQSGEQFWMADSVYHHSHNIFHCTEIVYNKSHIRGRGKWKTNVFLFHFMNH